MYFSSAAFKNFFPLGFEQFDYDVSRCSIVHVSWGLLTFLDLQILITLEKCQPSYIQILESNCKCIMPFEAVPQLTDALSTNKKFFSQSCLLILTTVLVLV